MKQMMAGKPNHQKPAQDLVNILTAHIWQRLGPMIEIDVLNDPTSGVVGKMSMPLCMALNIHPLIWERLTPQERDKVKRRFMPSAVQVESEITYQTA